MKKILVTGGGGYIGTVLSQNLLDRGYHVKVLDNFMFGDYLDNHPNLTKFKGDIRDKELVTQALRGTDCVTHLAAISNDPCSELDPDVTKQVNYEAPKYLIQASKKMGVLRFIFASSASIYGVKAEPEVTEDLEVEPITLYSKLKGEVEKVLFDSGDDDFATVALRSASVCGYSPRMRLDTILHIFVNFALNKGRILIEGGKQMRPLVHIRDIADFYSILIEEDTRKIDQQVFNVSYRNYEVREVAELVKSRIPCAIEQTNITDPRSYTLSTKKVASVLGFQPRRTIEEATDEVKLAFEKGLINPNDIRCYNVKLMKNHNFF